MIRIINLFMGMVLLLFLSSLNAVFASEPEIIPGKIIALAGISGIGKSTMAKELADSFSVECALEPEEPFWPEILQQHKTYDSFDVLMAFRQMWLVSYNKAVEFRTSGIDCFLDTIFIKILHYELGQRGIQWLFPSTNPYADVLLSVTRIDVSLLPDPDYIVLMECSFEDWVSLLRVRGRSFDQNAAFKSSFESSKKLIEDAVLRLAEERNIPVLRFNVIFGDPKEQSQRFKLFIKQNYLVEVIK